MEQKVTTQVHVCKPGDIMDDMVFIQVSKRNKSIINTNTMTFYTYMRDGSSPYYIMLNPSMAQCNISVIMDPPICNTYNEFKFYSSKITITNWDHESESAKRFLALYTYIYMSFDRLGLDISGTDVNTFNKLKVTEDSITFYVSIPMRQDNTPSCELIKNTKRLTDLTQLTTPSLVDIVIVPQMNYDKDKKALYPKLYLKHAIIKSSVSHTYTFVPQ